jgi:hypothetical protein
MGSITVKRSIGVQVIVTEQFKDELRQELQEAAEETQRRIDRMEFHGRRVLADLQGADITQAMAARKQIEAEKQRHETLKQDLERQIQEAEKLEIDSEYPRGTIEGTVELNEGDNLFDKLGNAQIVVKDGIILEVRES